MGLKPPVVKEDNKLILRYFTLGKFYYLADHTAVHIELLIVSFTAIVSENFITY